MPLYAVQMSKNAYNVPPFVSLFDLRTCILQSLGEHFSIKNTLGSTCELGIPQPYVHFLTCRNILPNPIQQACVRCLICLRHQRDAKMNQEPTNQIKLFEKRSYNDYNLKHNSGSTKKRKYYEVFKKGRSHSPLGQKKKFSRRGKSDMTLKVGIWQAEVGR